MFKQLVVVVAVILSGGRSMDQALDHNPRFREGLLQFTLHHSWVDFCDINDLHFSSIFPGYDAVLT